MRAFFSTLYSKISVIFLLLIFIFGAVEIFVSVKSSVNYVCEASQKINYTLAKNLADACQPFLTDSIDHVGIKESMAHLKMVNPRINAYLLDETGQIISYYNGNKALTRNQLNLNPIKKFLQENSYEELPIFGDDPITSSRHKVFSAARMQYGKESKSGYVYVTLASARYELASEGIWESYILSTSAIVLLVILLFSAGVGLLLFFLLTKRLHHMTGIVGEFEKGKYHQRIPIKSKDEISELGNAFNNMADTIEKNMLDIKKNDNLRRELIANISHDLRSPLSSIQGYIETILIKETVLSEDERISYLETILKNVTNLNHLVHELFELSKLDAMESEPMFEPFSIAELTQDVVLKFQQQAEQKGIHLITKIPVSLPFVYADISMMERVLSNLIDNALRYTPSDGKISIELKADNDLVGISITDTGSGIPAEDLPHIFDRFYKVEKSRSPNTGGSGLGLAIAKKMLDAHNCEIKVESRADSGTKFKFSLEKYNQETVKENTVI